MQRQPMVRCVSVMPASDWRESKRLYGYVPEEPLEPTAYQALADRIAAAAAAGGAPVEEDVDMETLRCAGGACPL
jgi:hypothetical protein